MRVVVMVSGGGTNLQAILNAVSDGRITNVKICGVISNRPDAFALQRAERAGIRGVCVSRKAYATRAEGEEALLEAVDSFRPDLIVLAGFLVIIPAEMIRRYECRIINIHPSLIPSFCGDGYYGLKVHEHVLARGVKVTGATVHYVDEGTDTGPILMQQAVPVQPGDTPEVLQCRVMEQAEWIILPQVINAIANDRICRDSNGNYFLTTD